MLMHRFRPIVLLVVLLLGAAPLWAQQPAPNRKAVIIDEILPQCPQAFANAPVSDAQRRQVIPFIVAELNELDGGNWGLLYRLDRQDETPENGRLTVDVIVWKPTKEHFDVLTDRGGMWKAHGVFTNPQWIVRDARDFPTICTPTSAPAPTPPPPVVVPEVPMIEWKTLIAGLQQQLLDLQTSLDDFKQAFALHADRPIPPIELPAIPCMQGAVIGRTVKLCPVTP